MKKIGLSLVLSSILLSPALLVAEENKAQMLQQSRQIVQKFVKNLNGELKAAMKKGGPTSVIQVCNEKAMAFLNHTQIVMVKKHCLM